MNYGTVSVQLGEDRDRGPVRLYYSRDAGGRQTWLAWRSGQSRLFRDAGGEHLSSLVGKALAEYRDKYDHLFQYNFDPLRQNSFLAGMLTGILQTTPDPE